jgi:hypothetical protein
MENAMKNTFLRILISAIIFSTISGIVVTIAGLIIGWKTSAQFSDGFFLAGGIMISIGLVTILGGAHGRDMSGGHYSQSALQLSLADHARRWTEEILHGYNTMAFLGISGLIMFGLAILAILVG